MTDVCVVCLCVRNVMLAVFSYLESNCSLAWMEFSDVPFQITVFVSGNSCEEDVSEYLSLLESQKPEFSHQVIFSLIKLFLCCLSFSLFLRIRIHHYPDGFNT